MPEDLLRVGSPEWLGRRCWRVAGYGEFGQDWTWRGGCGQLVRCGRQAGEIIIG